MLPKITVLYGEGNKAPTISWPIDPDINANRIYYIHSGKGRFYTGGEEFELRAGFLYFIPANVNGFRAEQDVNDPVFHTYFDFEMYPPVQNSIPLEIFVRKDSILNRCLETVSFIIPCVGSSPPYMVPDTEKSTGNSFVLSYELLIPSLELLLGAVCMETGISFVDDKVILSALREIHTNYPEKLSIKKLAEDAYLVPDHFIKRFKSCLGVTPYAYLRSLRLRKAANMRRLGYTMTKIAEEVGYSNAFSLSHAMKKISKNKKI